MDLDLTVKIGRLGADPEAPSGNGPTVLRMAVNGRQWNKDNQENEEVTTWCRVAVWGKTGQFAQDYLKKGSKVLVVGRNKPARAYINKHGSPAVACDNDCMVLEDITPRAATEAPSPYVREAKQSPKKTTPPPAQAQVPGTGNPFGDDDLPF